jgi:pimeloyl-ACP methyl ester carboxylesterase
VSNPDPAGEQDRLRGLDESMELHQGIRGSELKINAGHMLPMEAPTETQAMLAKFLQHNPA